LVWQQHLVSRLSGAPAKRSKSSLYCLLRPQVKQRKTDKLAIPNAASTPSAIGRELSL
jgi:hypothetical protein